MTPYTARALINDAWYLSGIVSKSLETVSDAQVEDGLNRLNALLAIKAANTGMVPYFNEIDFVSVIGQEKYFIKDLIEVETLTFNDPSNQQKVRFVSSNESRLPYFGTFRADFNSLPFSFHSERAKGGTNIFLYPFPNKEYPMKLWGKFLLQDVSLNQDMGQYYDGFFIEYIRVELAIYLCELYNIAAPPSLLKRLSSYEQICREVSPTDLTQNLVTMFPTRRGIDIFYYANILKGFVP